MKNILKFNILLIAVFALIFSGCKWIDTDLNIDPDQPADVPMELLLPSLQGSAAYTIGGNTAVRTSNIWMQLFDGVDRQSLAEGRYNITSSDVNDFWENLYAQSMMDCKTLITKAEEQNAPYYAGIAKVMLALNLGTLTNFFGDMPYTDAFLGDEAVLQPAYDSQESIYGTIFTLLDAAIVDFAVPEADNAVDVESDLIYDGDIGLWTKAAYALKARYSLYKKDYAAAITNADLSFVSPSEDFIFLFEDSESGANPIYQFMRDRTDIRMGSTFVDMLLANGDPRLPFYAAVSDLGGYVGSIPGSENALASKPGTYNASMYSPAVFSSFSEVQLIKAEAINRRDGVFNADALTAFQNAVGQSVLAVTGDSNDAWMVVNVYSETVGTLTMEDLIIQKYIAMYSTVIPFDDWRRTGYPTLLTVIGATGNTPVRYPYPQSEITYNENCPSGVTANDDLWIFQ